MELKDRSRLFVMIICLVLALATTLFLGYFLGSYTVLEHYMEPGVPTIKPDLLSVIGVLL